MSKRDIAKQLRERAKEHLEPGRRVSDVGRMTRAEIKALAEQIARLPEIAG